METTDQFDKTHFLSLEGTSRTLRPGDLIGGSYRLKGLIGRGGMGYVFLAEHIVIGKDYALKIISPEKFGPESCRRFEAEARIIANLNHPNIVKIYNMGLDGGKCPYYVMDLLSGRPLSELIGAEGEIDLSQWLDIFQQVAEGLDYAHRHGIVHRDVKPSNLILQTGRGAQAGLVKIVDFGIAKILDKTKIKGQSLTASGEVFGSPLYMSPEQCLGRPIDSRSDIYSLGCSLFECLCGEPPFRGENVMDTMMMHVEAVMPTLADKYAGDEELPDGLEYVLERMTAKNPAQRYQSMDQVAHDLERVSHGLPVGRVVGASRRVADSRTSGSERQSFLAIWLLLLLVVPGYLVFCAGAKLFAAGGSFLPWQSHPAESKDALVATAEANAQPAKTPACQKLLAELSRLGKFECSLQSDLGTGRVRFVFPDEKIGSLIDNVNAHDARGTVWVRKGEPLNFIVDDYLEPTAFVCPELFEHFGPDDLTSLHIKCNPGSKGAYDSLSPSDEADLVLTRVLRTISTWRRLKSLNLDGFRETKKNLEQVGDLPALERLALARSSCRMSDLAECSWLGRLQYLDIDDPQDFDVAPVLKQLGRSSVLWVLLLKGVILEDPVLSDLQACSHLQSLGLTKTTVSDKLLQTLVAMPALRKVRLINVPLSAEQLNILNQCGRLRVTIFNRDSTSDENAKLRKNYSRLVILDSHPGSSGI